MFKGLYRKSLQTGKRQNPLFVQNRHQQGHQTPFYMFRLILLLISSLRILGRCLLWKPWWVESQTSLFYLVLKFGSKGPELQITIKCICAPSCIFPILQIFRRKLGKAATLTSMHKIWILVTIIFSFLLYFVCLWWKSRLHFSSLVNSIRIV